MAVLAAAAQHDDAQGQQRHEHHRQATAPRSARHPMANPAERSARFDAPRVQSRSNEPARRERPQGQAAGQSRSGGFERPRLPVPSDHRPVQRPRQTTTDNDPDRPRNPAHQIDPDGEPTERLNKRMAALGLASRREADEWIDRGFVKVNGVVARMGQQVRQADAIDIDPAAKREQEQQVTILLNKPIGYVSGQAEDGHPPAIFLIAENSMNALAKGKIRFENWHLRHLAPAGRLDIDSTGLLVLTQDGRVARAIIGEDSDMEKEYLVRVEYQGAQVMGQRTSIDDADDIQPTDGAATESVKRNVKAVFPTEGIERLRHGLSLDNQALLPAKVSWQNEEQLRFVLREGKKRQIRRMCEAVGLKVVGLKRIRIGRVVLGDLPPGQWRYLQPFERF